MKMLEAVGASCCLKVNEMRIELTLNNKILVVVKVM